MKCKEVKWLLALYDSGELNPQEQEIVETHLVSCEKCCRELARLKEVPALIQSLHGDTWWADVSSSIKERIDTSGAKGRPSQAEPVNAGKEGAIRGRPAWRPVRIGSLAAAIIHRPIWQSVLISFLVISIIVGASLAVIRPWGSSNIIQAAADLARNNSQVQVILGEGGLESEVVLTGDIAQVKYSVTGVFGYDFVTVEVDTANMRVIAIHTEDIAGHQPEPIIRPELTEEEKTMAIEVAEADSYIQAFLGHGYTLGEPSNSHPVLGADIRRVVWLSLEGDPASDEYRGVIVNLDDWGDAMVMWEGQIPTWWPY